MCGLNVIYQFGAAHQQVDRMELARVSQRMQARGPDGSGEWLSPDGRVGLAHRRLAIIDLSESANQPMRLAGHPQSPVIVFNGEIYNYRELRTRLEDDGCQFVTESDTEVLLHLYRKHGRDMGAQLRGMYAFAVWDPGRRGLLLCRDPLGIKPLYYAIDGTNIRAASQAQALMAGAGVDRTHDPAGHVGFFLFGYVPEPYTMWKGVKALPAGSTLWCDERGPNGPHQTLDMVEMFRHGTSRTCLDLQDRREVLKNAISDSVKSHLVADVPVGIFLSSGYDSTAIAALATKIQGGGIHTCTLGFSEFAGTSLDEVPHATAVARHLGTLHHNEFVDKSGFDSEKARLLAAMDLPSIDGVNTYFVARAAARTGLKVALSGVGGDELFGGYPSFRDIPRLVRLSRGVSRLPGVGKGLRIVTAALCRKLTSPKYAGLFEYGGTVAGAYLLRRALFAPWELAGILDPEFAAAGWSELSPRIHLEEVSRGQPNMRAAISAMEMAWYMRGQLLRDADWAGMAHSLEIRTPLVDRSVLEQLVPSIVGPGPPTKHDLFSIVENTLPAALKNRPKTGFATPVGRWLNSSNPYPERGLRGWARVVYATQASSL